MGDEQSDAFLKAVCLAGEDRPLTNVWRDHFKDIPGGRFSKQKFGYHLYGHQDTGMLAIYPSADYCAAYDPRFRPWYASAATGPKNIVIIIDKSGSMRDYDRMNIAKAAIKKVLNTLTWSDFAQVIYFASRVDLFGD